MNIKDIVIILVLIMVLALSITYIIKAKKSGAKCIGCPSSKECGSNNNTSCGCGCSECNSENN